jgi:hypothetical protein
MSGRGLCPVWWNNTSVQASPIKYLAGPSRRHGGTRTTTSLPAGSVHCIGSNLSIKLWSCFSPDSELGRDIALTRIRLQLTIYFLPPYKGVCRKTRQVGKPACGHRFSARGGGVGARTWRYCLTGVQRWLPCSPNHFLFPCAHRPGKIGRCSQ